ncbi:Homocysteine S-methyltransferase 2 [Bienertia sinuspersici]
MSSLLSEFLEKSGGVAIVDGGLATELERYGADLNDPLWSAKCLVTSPHLVRQATIQGFKAKGLSEEESEALIKKSVEIACEARDLYYKKCDKKDIDDSKIPKHRPIFIAASVGSYGAYLADGSEYSGDYGNAGTLDFLKEFHRRRVQILAESGADLIAFETTPNKIEAQAYAELLHEEDVKIPAWFTFNSKDGENVVSGDSMLECASVAEASDKVVAVGINCTPPRFIEGLILSIKKVTTKPIIVYPNSGETYDPVIKEWVQNTGVPDEDFVSYVKHWWKAGASIFGGCCRTTPKTISGIYNTLSERSVSSGETNN